MAALMDAPHQGADGGMLRFVLGIELRVGAATDVIEGAADAGGVALIHQPLKGVERIGGMELAATGQADTRSLQGTGQVAIFE
jgi:hypothetical protein